MDEALREKSGYTLPPKIHISQQDGDYYNVMPCIYKRGNLAMVKMIGRHGHENRIMDLFRQDPDVHFVLCDTYEEVIGGSDLVISAITKVTENFVTDEYFKEGCTVIPICTMGFQNCDLFFDRVFTDEIEQIRGFKYFDHFAPVTTNVTDVLNGAAPGRTDNVAFWCITTASPSMTWSLPPTSMAAPPFPTRRTTTAGKNTLSDAFGALYCVKTL